MSTNEIVKVRSYGGAGINNIYVYKIRWLLKNQPSYMVLHVGTNDHVNKSTEIFEGETPIYVNIQETCLRSKGLHFK